MFGMRGNEKTFFFKHKITLYMRVYQSVAIIFITR